MDQRIQIDATHQASFEEVFRLGRQIQKTFAVTTGLMGAGAIFMILDAILVWDESNVSERTTMLILAFVFLVLCVLSLIAVQKKNAVRIGITVMRQRIAMSSPEPNNEQEQAFSIDGGHDLIIYVDRQKGTWRHLLHETISDEYLIKDIEIVHVTQHGQVLYDREKAQKLPNTSDSFYELLIQMKSGEKFAFNATNHDSLQTLLVCLEKKESQDGLS